VDPLFDPRRMSFWKKEIKSVANDDDKGTIDSEMILSFFPVLLFDTYIFFGKPGIRYLFYGR
jgi:hypothetical protein